MATNTLTLSPLISEVLSSPLELGLVFECYDQQKVVEKRLCHCQI